jgi:hypothetical protein
MTDLPGRTFILLMEMYTQGGTTFNGMRTPPSQNTDTLGLKGAEPELALLMMSRFTVSKQLIALLQLMTVSLSWWLMA